MCGKEKAITIQIIILYCKGIRLMLMGEKQSTCYNTKDFAIKNKLQHHQPQQKLK
jgi:hypothetical protein